MSTDRTEKIVTAALLAWATSLGLGPGEGGAALAPGARPPLPHIGLSLGPTQHSHVRLAPAGLVAAGTRAEGLVGLFFFGAPTGYPIPVGSLFTSPAGFSYVTLTPGWCILFSGGTVGAFVQARAVEVGSASNILVGSEGWSSPTLEFNGGGVAVLDPIVNGSDATGTSAVIWSNGYDTCEAKWHLRAPNPDASQDLVNGFRARLALEAMRSNPDGSPVLHFAVTLAGETRTGKVYQTGFVGQPDPVKVGELSLFESELGALVVFPRFVVEGASEATGLMDITISVNGVEYALADAPEGPGDGGSLQGPV